jgi:hypothetical protein
MFDRVDMKYSPPGYAPHTHTHTHTHAHTHTTHNRHTFMENDRCFGGVSRKAKKTKLIGSSKAWMNLGLEQLSCLRCIMIFLLSHQSETAQLRYQLDGPNKVPQLQVKSMHVPQAGRIPPNPPRAFLSAKYKRPSQWKNTQGDKVPFLKIRWFNFGNLTAPGSHFFVHGSLLSQGSGKKQGRTEKRLCASILTRFVPLSPSSTV